MPKITKDGEGAGRGCTSHGAHHLYGERDGESLGGTFLTFTPLQDCSVVPRDVQDLLRAPRSRSGAATLTNLEVHRPLLLDDGSLLQLLFGVHLPRLFGLQRNAQSEIRGAQHPPARQDGGTAHLQTPAPPARTPLERGEGREMNGVLQARWIHEAFWGFFLMSGACQGGVA